MHTIVEGEKLPKFSAQATNGLLVHSEAYLGKNIVLYFYPRDNTPGCTAETEDFVKYYDAFLKAETVIFGISRDSLASHEKFKAKLQIPFELISDPEENLCQLFSVMKDKMMYGKKVRGIERTTVLVNQEGVIKQIWRKVKVPDHVVSVLKAL